MVFNLTNVNGTDVNGTADELVRGLYLKLLNNVSNDNLTIEFCSKSKINVNGPIGPINKADKTDKTGVCGTYHHSSMNFKDLNKTILNPEGLYSYMIV